ncbi:Isochorismatase family protein [compost metagenome]
MLTPQNSQLIFIDHQPQMAFGVQSIDRQTLKNNTVGLAKAARIFNIPTIITTVETESFSGHTYPELLDVFPGQKLLERTSMNAWDDQKVRDALAKGGVQIHDHRLALCRVGKHLQQRLRLAKRLKCTRIVANVAGWLGRGSGRCVTGMAGADRRSVRSRRFGFAGAANKTPCQDCP